MAFHPFLDPRNVFERLAVVVGEFAARRHLPFEMLMGERQCPVDEVSEDGDQFIVVAGLEITPRKVVIFCFGRIHRQHVTQDILLAGEVLQILMQPHRPIAGGRYLVAFEIQELVGGYILRKDK